MRMRTNDTDSRRRYMAAALLERAQLELERAEQHDAGGFWLIASKADELADRLLEITGEVNKASGPTTYCQNDLGGYIADQIRTARAEVATEAAANRWHNAEVAEMLRDHLIDVAKPLELPDEVTWR